MKNCRVFPPISSKSSKSPKSYGGSPPRLLRMRSLHNLMHTLTAKVKLIGNLAEGLTLFAQLQNLRIARLVRRRARLQRAPLPTRYLFESSHAVGGQGLLLVPLPNVANPGAYEYFGPIHNFDMNSGASRVAFAGCELLKGFDVQTESGVVIHVTHFRTSVYLMRERLRDFSQKDEHES